MRADRLAAALAVLLAVGLAAAPAVAEPLATSARHHLAEVVHEVEPVLAHYGYPAILGIVALDTLGLPTPAASIMVAATLAADRHELRLEVVALLAFVATVLGSQGGYLLGRLGGRGLLGRLPLARERVTRLETSYRRWGSLIVIWAPLSEGLRQLNGLVAGTLGLAWHRFALANLLGSAIFVGLWVGGAWLLDEHLARIAPFLHAARWWLIAAACLGAIAVLAWLWQRRGDPARPERHGTDNTGQG